MKLKILLIKWESNNPGEIFTKKLPESKHGNGNTILERKFLN